MLCYGLINRLRLSFRQPQTIGTVAVGEGGICGVCAGGGCGELAAILPGKGPAAVAQGVATAVVCNVIGGAANGDRLQQVLPVPGAVAVALEDGGAVSARLRFSPMRQLHTSHRKFQVAL